jgi:hypothetical protein
MASPKSAKMENEDAAGVKGGLQNLKMFHRQDYTLILDSNQGMLQWAGL